MFLSPPAPRGSGGVRTVIFLRRSMILSRLRPGSGGNLFKFSVLALSAAGLSVCLHFRRGPKTFLGASWRAAAPQTPPPYLVWLRPPRLPKKDPDDPLKVYKCHQPPKYSYSYVRNTPGRGATIQGCIFARGHVGRYHVVECLCNGRPCGSTFLIAIGRDRGAAESLLSDKQPFCI